MKVVINEELSCRDVRLLYTVDKCVKNNKQIDLSAVEEILAKLT